MTDPYIAVVMPTLQRTEYALRTIRGLASHLEYGDWGLYIADAGSSAEHLEHLLAALGPIHLLGWHTGAYSPGENWNLGWDQALRASDVVLWVEDDFELQRPLDIAPYVRLLLERGDVGMVRLGGMVVGLDLFSVGYRGRHYLQMRRSTQCAFSGHPHLKHRRFREAYGPYTVGHSPGETELDYDAAFRAKAGPEIWWPLDIGGWGVFGHIGTVPTH